MNLDVFPTQLEERSVVFWDLQALKKVHKAGTMYGKLEKKSIGQCWLLMVCPIYNSLNFDLLKSNRKILKNIWNKIWKSLKQLFFAFLVLSIVSHNVKDAACSLDISYSNESLELLYSSSE